MKKITRLLIIDLLLVLTIGCSKSNLLDNCENANFEISYSDIDSISNNCKRFYLFVYAPWCPHCQQSIPLVRSIFSSRNDAYYLNGETMSVGEHASLRTGFVDVLDDGDPLLASDSTRVLYPSVGLYVDKELVYAKSGLPKTERNLKQLIRQIEEDYPLTTSS